VQPLECSRRDVALKLKKATILATAKKASAAKKAVPAKKAVLAKSAAPATKVGAPAALKPIKTAFNKTSLQVHLAEFTGVEPKIVKAVLAGLEATMVASLNKKGLGEFTLPGLLKVTAVAIPAKRSVAVLTHSQKSNANLQPSPRQCA
jgi:hypothetical protein